MAILVIRKINTDIATLHMYKHIQDLESVAKKVYRL